MNKGGKGAGLSLGRVADGVEEEGKRRRRKKKKKKKKKKRRRRRRRRRRRSRNDLCIVLVWQKEIDSCHGCVQVS